MNPEQRYIKYLQGAVERGILTPAEAREQYNLYMGIK